MAENKQEKPVWMKCRATEGCEGNQAIIVFQKDLNDLQLNRESVSQGNVVRYRCLTCGKSFHITR